MNRARAVYLERKLETVYDDDHHDDEQSLCTEGCATHYHIIIIITINIFFGKLSFKLEQR